MTSIVIAGAGQAGARAAEAMRGAAFAGTITLVGREPHPPYERPQLSKELLLGTRDEAEPIKSAAAWGELGIDLVLGKEVVDFDRIGRLARLSDGSALPCDRLLIATGTRPRRLPFLEGGPLPVHYLRTIEDSDAIRRALVAKARLAIIGGGVIGLEAAAAAAQAGCAVTVIEAAPSLLGRALPALASDFLKSRHQAHGVAFRLGVAPEGVDRDGLVLADGSRVAADAILVGIGVEPETALAERLGLATADGIEIDHYGGTTDQTIFAAGDVALQFSPWHGRRLRIETWANAQDQAIATARSMVGLKAPYDNPPWFWSDQYDINLQVVGDPLGPDPILRGDPAAGRFSLIVLRDGRINGAVVINAPRDMAMLRRLTASLAAVARSDLADPAFDLRRALAAKP